MPPKKKPATPKLSTPVDSHKHKDKCISVPTEELCGFGGWAFLEIVDPYDTNSTIRKFIKGEKVDGVEPIFRGE